MRALRTLIPVVLAGALLAAAPSSACAQSSVYIRLDALPAESSPTSRFYYVAESESSTTFRVRRLGDNCDFIVASVRYSAADETAVNGRDYDLESARTVDLHDPQHPATQNAPSYQDVQVGIIDNSEVGPVVRKAMIELSEPSNATIVAPGRAALYIVDDDGPSRFAFAESLYSQSENMTQVIIPVFRAGDVSQAASVAYTVDSGTEPSATPGEDFTSPSSGSLSFAPGQRVRNIEITLVADGRAEQDEHLQVTLTGASVAEPSTTTLEILDTDEAPPEPRSRFHHPRHELRYPYDDYRLREVHVFTRDTTGFGVERAQWALRKKMRNGRCAWLSGEGFRRGSCSKKQWLRMRVYDPGLFYYYRLDPLRPSAGTRIRNYTAYSRAIDARGNRETTFRAGRNANTFEVRRR